MTEAAAETAGVRRTPTWLVATIAGGIGLFYAYAVWNALSFLLVLASGPLGLSGWGWFVLVFAVAFPILAFAGAFALGYRRPAHHLLLIMLTGLALVAVFWLDVIAYSTLFTFSLLGGG